MRQPSPKTTAPTFADVALAYTHTSFAESVCTASALDSIRRYLVDQTVNPWADKPVDEVLDSNVELLALILEQKSERLARSSLVRLEALFHWASAPIRRSRYRLLSAPSPGPALLARLRVKRRLLTRAEMRRYIDASARADRLERFFYRSIVYTGFAVSHLAGIRMRQVDFAKRVWQSPYSDVELPLSDKMIWMLTMFRDHHGNDDFAFTIGGAPLDFAAVEKLRVELAEHMEAVGHEADPPQTMRGWTFADVRRTVLLELQEIGLSEELARIATARTTSGRALSRDVAFNSYAIQAAVNTLPRIVGI